MLGVTGDIPWDTPREPPPTNPWETLGRTPRKHEGGPIEAIGTALGTRRQAPPCDFTRDHWGSPAGP